MKDKFGRPVMIRMWNYHACETVLVEVTEEPILVDDYDGEDTWFEVSIGFLDGDEYYAHYDEKNLRWESG